MENLREGTKVHKMLGTIVGIVGIIVTLIDIAVAIISIQRNAEENSFKRQNSNRPDQS